MTRDDIIEKYLLTLEKEAIVNLILKGSSDRYLNSLRTWVSTQYY